MIKTAIVLAIIGHILCGVSDCLLSYSPKGRLNLKDIQDQRLPFLDLDILLWVTG